MKKKPLAISDSADIFLLSGILSNLKERENNYDNLNYEYINSDSLNSDILNSDNLNSDSLNSDNLISDNLNSDNLNSDEILQNNTNNSYVVILRLSQLAQLNDIGTCSIGYRSTD